MQPYFDYEYELKAYKGVTLQMPLERGREKGPPPMYEITEAHAAAVRAGVVAKPSEG